MTDAEELWKPSVTRAILRLVERDDLTDAERSHRIRITQNPQWVPDRPEARLPTLWAIASYWAEQDSYFVVTLERPECFACGMLGKVQDGPVSSRWTSSAGKIQRGHLVNRARDGLDQVQNLVPLCAFCNRLMPIFGPEQADDAIDWVLDGGWLRRWDEYNQAHLYIEPHWLSCGGS